MILGINKSSGLPVVGLLTAMMLAGCGDGSPEPSAAEKALNELQSKYDELAKDKLDDPLQWASDDLENIGDWEYKVVDLTAVPTDKLEGELNELGDDRWEVIWVDEARGGRVVILKRPSVSLLSRIPLSQLGRMVIGGSDSEQ